MSDSYRILPISEFRDIRDDEIEIVNQLKDKYNYMTDEYGDIMFDKIGNPIIDYKNIPIPSTLSVSGKNRFSHRINGKSMSNTVPNNIIDGYKDVLGIDDQLIDTHIDGYNVRVLALFSDNEYQGCVWIFTSKKHPQFVGMYGIRSSVVNTLTGVSGIARRVFMYMIDTYVKNGMTIVVPWPLDPLPILLNKLGFKEYNEYDQTPERRFLEPITSTYNYYTLSSVQ